MAHSATHSVTVQAASSTAHGSSHAAAHGGGAHAAGHGGGHGSSVHHVVPLRTLTAVFVWLMVLTVATVGATLFDFGYTMNLVLAMAIAVVKAALVMLYFMHLRWDSPFNAVVAIGSLLFVALFIIVCIVDSEQYAKNYVPPGVGQSAPR
ncbi:MAG: cytochrome C oxidase subunit IV family protein [Tepidisphaerales bacterium]